MMSEEKTQPIFPDAIALPPLKMILVFAKEARMNKAMPAAVTKKDEFESTIQQEHVETQDLKKIIKHLEKKS